MLGGMGRSKADAGAGERGVGQERAGHGSNGAPGEHGEHAEPGESTEVDLVLRLARRWRHTAREHTAEHGLSPHQDRALLMLARLSAHRSATPGASSAAPDGVRISRLAEALGIAPRSATEVADALETAGLVERTPDPADRRAVLLVLTPEARHTVQRVRARRRAAAEEALATLLPADRAELRRILGLLLAR